MWNKVKTAVSVAGIVKNGVSAVLHPIQFVKNKAVDVLVSSFIKIVLALASDGLKEKLKKSTTATLKYSKNIAVPEEWQKNINNEFLYELSVLLTDSGNQALETFGFSIHALSLSKQTDSLEVLFELGLKNSITNKLK